MSGTSYSIKTPSFPKAASGADRSKMFMVNVSVHARINMAKYPSGKVMEQYLALHDLHGFKSSKVALGYHWGNQ